MRLVKNPNVFLPSTLYTVGGVKVLILHYQPVSRNHFTVTETALSAYLIAGHISFSPKTPDNYMNTQPWVIVAVRLISRFKDRPTGVFLPRLH